MNPHSAQSSIASIDLFGLSVANTAGGQIYCVATSGDGASINPLDESTLTCSTIPAWIDKATQDHPPPFTISIPPGGRDVLSRNADDERVDFLSAESIDSHSEQVKPAEEPHAVENATSRLELSFRPSQLKQVTVLLLKHGIDYRFVNDTTQEQREDLESMSWGSVCLQDSQSRKGKLKTGAGSKTILSFS
jgi:hypothetical protein